jgi:hypothetical protein
MPVGYSVEIAPPVQSSVVVVFEKVKKRICTPATAPPIQMAAPEVLCCILANLEEMTITQFPVAVAKRSLLSECSVNDVHAALPSSKNAEKTSITRFDENRRDDRHAC